MIDGSLCPCRCEEFRAVPRMRPAGQRAGPQAVLLGARGGAPRELAPSAAGLRRAPHRPEAAHPATPQHQRPAWLLLP